MGRICERSAIAARYLITSVAFHNTDVGVMRPIAIAFARLTDFLKFALVQLEESRSVWQWTRKIKARLRLGR